MDRPLRALFLLAALPMTLGGCGLLAKWLAPKPRPDKDAGTKDVYIGVIDLVNPEQRFVLIRTAMKLNLQAGWKLETRPVGGPKSIVTVSPEQKLNFLSADITEGSPQKGEIVVLPPQLSTAAANPDTPAAPAGAPALPEATRYSLPPPIP